MFNRSPRHLFHDKSTHYPLVDGVFAIAMTLISLEFPDIFLENIVDNSSLPSFLSKVVITIMLVAEYLISFLILYEMWSLHRSIFKCSESTKGSKENVITVLFLASVAFIPAATTVIVRELIHRGEVVFSLGSVVTHARLHPHSMYFVQVISFLLLGFLAKSAPVYRKRSRLRHIYKQTIVRALFFLALTIFSVLLSTQPPSLAQLFIYPTVPLLFYLYVFVFKAQGFTRLFFRILN